MKPVVLYILYALGARRKHGYAIMRTISQRSNGAIQILPGTLYSTIKRMLADGLLQECEAPEASGAADVRRRYYKVTKAGRRAARSEAKKLELLLKLSRAFRD